MQIVKGSMTIGEVVAKYPQAVEIMLDYGLHCIGCHVSPYETIEGGAKGHGMSEQETAQMLETINKTVSKSEQLRSSGNAIELTEFAASHLHRLMVKENKESHGLRVTVKPGGCAGFTYEMEFAKEALQSDEVFETQGVKIFFDKEVEPYLRGTVIDYKDSLHGSGFVMSNPNAKTSCGCGKSMGV